MQRAFDPGYFQAYSIYWALIGALYRRRVATPNPGDTLHDGYNIYVDAKNGNNQNSGLFENVPVQTIHQAGLVLRGLPSDRETKGVRIWLWASTPGDDATLYRDYNDLSTAVGAPKSAFIGLHNYWLSTNPNSPGVAVLDGGSYSKTDSRRVAHFNRNGNDFFRPTFLYLAGNNITVQKLEITGAAGSCIRHVGNHSVFRDLHVHDTTADAVHSSGADNLFDFMYVHHVNENLTQGRASDGIRMQDATRPTIRNCVVHNVGGEAYNFDDSVFDGLMVLNDAFDIGWPLGYGNARPARSTGRAYKLSGTLDRNQRNVALANRAWRNVNGFFAMDGGAHTMLHNVAVDSTLEEGAFRLKGDNGLLLGNNIVYGGRAWIIDLTRPGYWPRQRSNSWGSDASMGSFAQNVGLSLSPPEESFRSFVRPDAPPAVGFTGEHYLPIESKFAGKAYHEWGFGKHVGPTAEVVAALRSMSPQQIRDRLKLFL